MCYNKNANGDSPREQWRISSFRTFHKKGPLLRGRPTLLGRARVNGMKITIYGKQMMVRESLKTAVDKKLSKFDKFFGDDTEAFVTCKVRKGVKIIEITVNYGGTPFRSEEESDYRG